MSIAMDPVVAPVGRCREIRMSRIYPPIVTSTVSVSAALQNDRSGDEVVVRRR
jgi:hypothetical protein